MPLAKPRLKPNSNNRLAELLRIWVIPEQEKRQLEELCDSLAEYLETSQIEDVRRAYEIGAAAHDGQRRIKGEKYINHPLSVARLLAELHFDSRTIIAAILHDTLEDTHLTRGDIVRDFGEDVAALVEGVSKVVNLEFASPEHAEAENLRRMFLAMSHDIRVIFIKLADRLHNLESLDVHKLKKRIRIVRQTQEIYIPVANLLGLQDWKGRMEDLCFKSIYPNRYKIIKKAIKQETKGKIEETIKTHVEAIKKMLGANKIESRVSGRFKNISAIHDKMRRKGNSLKAVQDLFAFRVIVYTVDECYRTLGVIHNIYKPISGEFNDYIAIPKNNGYQSLHTTVNAQFPRTIEVQIRTTQMHQFTQAGIASHWKYKNEKNFSQNSKLPAMEWLTEIIHALEENEAPGVNLENLKLSLFPDDVYVFTPKNKVKRLMKGATVIDYAYAVHTEVGNRAKSARINNEDVAFHTVLSNGDRVEIATKMRSSKPDPAWLQFAVTANARMGIRKALRAIAKSELEKMGDRLLKRALKKNKIKISSITPEKKEKLVKELKATSWSDILCQISKGRRVAAVIVTQIFPETLWNSDLRNSDDMLVSIRGTEGLAVQYAKCCSPIPDEPIMGFFSVERGIVIHTENCKHVRKSRHRTEHWARFQWTDRPTGHFKVSIQVDALNKPGVLAGITSRIAVENANISDCRLDTDKGHALIKFDIEVTDITHLEQIMRGIQRDPSVRSIRRI